MDATKGLFREQRVVNTGTLVGIPSRKGHIMNPIIGELLTDKGTVVLSTPCHLLPLPTSAFGTVCLKLGSSCGRVFVTLYLMFSSMPAHIVSY